VLALPVALACLTHAGALFAGNVPSWGRARAGGLAAPGGGRPGRLTLLGLRGGADQVDERDNDDPNRADEGTLSSKTADGRNVVSVTEQFIANEVTSLQSYLPHLQQYQNPLVTRAWPINTNFVGINETVTDTVFCNSLRAQSKGLVYNQVPPPPPRLHMPDSDAQQSGRASRPPPASQPLPITVCIPPGSIVVARNCSPTAPALPPRPSCCTVVLALWDTESSPLNPQPSTLNLSLPLAKPAPPETRTLKPRP